MQSLSGADRPSSIRHVLQGGLEICLTPQEELHALLGSCVAACLRDPVLRIGGMNHFLLPGATTDSGSSIRYGAHAMEVLINSLMREGARRDRLEVYLFGGAKVMKGLPHIGESNCTFARQFVRDEGLRLTHTDLGGQQGRRIRFKPATGEYHVSLIAMEEPGLPSPPSPKRSKPDAPDLDIW